MSGILTGGGFTKIPLKPQAQNNKNQKVRLYQLKDQSDGAVAAAKQAVKTEQTDSNKERDYTGKIKSFETDVKTKPYLLKEGDTLKLLSEVEARQIQIDYGDRQSESGDGAAGAGVEVHHTTTATFEGAVSVGRDLTVGGQDATVFLSIGGVRTDISAKLQAIRDANDSDRYRQQEHQLYIPQMSVEDPGQIQDQSAKTPLQDRFGMFVDFENPQRVFVLQAPAGTGKSMFTQRIEDQMFAALDADSEAPIPLRIELGGLADPVHHAVEEGLENKGFTEAEIEALKEKKVVIILDGVDEARYEGRPLSQVTKLFLTNKLYLWKQAKVVFGIRIGGASETKMRLDRFYPYVSDSRDSAEPDQLAKGVICPFDQGNREAYIQNYVDHAPAEWQTAYPDWAQNNGQKYFTEIRRIQGGAELSETPFMLRVIAEVLPGIVTQAEQEAADGGETTEITESMLYETFIGGWFEREEGKLDTLPSEIEDVGLAEFVWDYCMNLAGEMRAEGENGITKVLYKPRSRFSRAAVSKWDIYFGDDPVCRTCLRVAPIRKNSLGEYSFIHDYILQFLVSRAAKLEALDQPS